MRGPERADVRHLSPRQQGQHLGVVLEAVRHQYSSCAWRTPERGHGLIPIGSEHRPRVGKARRRRETRPAVGDRDVPSQQSTDFAQGLRVIAGAKDQQSCHRRYVLHEHVSVGVQCGVTAPGLTRDLTINAPEIRRHATCAVSRSQPLATYRQRLTRTSDDRRE